MNRTFFLNLFKEAVGYESGLLRTIVDLYKDPKKVVNASIRNDLTYVNPVKFMITLCGYFVVVNGFFIDWYSVSLKHFQFLNQLIFGTNDIKTEIIQARVIEIIFSTGLIPFLISVVILQLYFISKKVDKSQYPFEYHKDVLFYFHGFNVLLYFIFSLSATFLPTNIFLIFYTVFVFASLIGFKKLVELKPLKAYFANTDESLLKIYKTSQLKAVGLIAFVGLIIGVLWGVIELKF